MIDFPKVSVVTVVYNNLMGIAKTIQSVCEQTYSNLEYIIVDGGSSDGTVDVINRYNARIDFFVSEPDRGIYDAMNKGISLATGDYVIFMNSGDYFTDQNVVTDVFEKAPAGAELIYGDIIAEYGNLSKLIQARPLNKLKYGMVFSHQALFAKQAILNQNKFNLKYRIAADFNFVYQCFVSRYSFAYVAIPIAHISVGGLSDNNYKVLDENRSIVSTHENGRKFYSYIVFKLLACNILIRSAVKKMIGKKLTNRVVGRRK